ncbi:hypothetical protein SPRG_02696 [Saprolegnia parasitica CBS 223.65]|uniref:PPM-type phosphatase domain-containing protein n=1 Tax=Saprolegnia parasitica (strain CBS 223.65) TaxID=695850 RepID=A0A067CUR1_SAPPC|nr:hypothetical protein SPRG_02696 [Saprolegnia parasitica CBS 223.65]KDO33005.1 hypothetical protein SPRG_02696 [Saprolegnia parasitica CBS 223.65]|eukprot:XP_012196649.1 hypothetical protein SPRG_02696 [Saprolegnia parasitica CBS 223.65]
MSAPPPPSTKSVVLDLEPALGLVAPPPETLVAIPMDAEMKKRRSSTIKLQPRAPVSGAKRPQFIPRRHSGVSRVSRPSESELDLSDLPGVGKPSSSHNIVLKMTIHTDEDVRTSFVVTQDPRGCGIGRKPANVVSIPADKYMADLNHAVVTHAVHPLHGPGFYITNGNDGTNATYIRLSPVSLDDHASKTQWPLSLGCQFRAGKSDIEVLSLGPSSLRLKVLSGKLVGNTYDVDGRGATIGRSADNTIHTGDGELSRRHASIWCDAVDGRFYVHDVGSTNGTFMKLCGAYADPYRLEIGDHILVSQTCLSVNRFDYGVNDNMGCRKHMEDAHSLIQDMNIAALSKAGYAPQSFFGVFDGHGGLEASVYLHDNLHKHIISELQMRTADADLSNAADVDALIVASLTTAFEQTDAAFLQESDRPQAGSTATTVFIAGRRMYVANVGDSRTVLSRNGVAVRLSNDHKPSRPDEAQRIRDTGGFIIHGRIMGELAVSRAFGDCEFKTYDTHGSQSSLRLEDEFGVEQPVVNPNEILKGPLVIATPEVTTSDVTDEEDFLLLGSDGLFDVFEDQEAVDFVTTQLRKGGDVQRTVEALVEYAIGTQGSRDNVTAIVVLFKDIAAM